MEITIYTNRPVSKFLIYTRNKVKKYMYIIALSVKIIGVSLSK